MKTDRTALFWGTIIGVVIVIGAMVQVFEFPQFKAPFTDTHAIIFLITALVYGLLIAAYRKLWKIPSFWSLLVAFLTAHIMFYWLFVAKIAYEIRGFQMDVLYGLIGGAEALVFSLVVLRIYHRGPDTRSFTGRRTH